MLMQAGYPHVKALKGGVAAWKEAGFPMVGA
jgi:rhodanese-related sulfurtransferase